MKQLASASMRSGLARKRKVCVPFENSERRIPPLRWNVIRASGWIGSLASPFRAGRPQQSALDDRPRLRDVEIVGALWPRERSKTRPAPQRRFQTTGITVPAIQGQTSPGEGGGGEDLVAGVDVEVVLLRAASERFPRPATTGSSGRAISTAVVDHVAGVGDPTGRRP